MQKDSESILLTFLGYHFYFSFNDLYKIAYYTKCKILLHLLLAMHIVVFIKINNEYQLHHDKLTYLTFFKFTLMSSLINLCNVPKGETKFVREK